MSDTIDLRKDVIRKVADRMGFHTLSNITEYEAVLLSIMTYINTSNDIDPQALIEHYLDYKLSVSASARKELIELFKHTMGSPDESASEDKKEGKRGWKMF